MLASGFDTAQPLAPTEDAGALDTAKVEYITIDIVFLDRNVTSVRLVKNKSVKKTKGQAASGSGFRMRNFKDRQT